MDYGGLLDRLYQMTEGTDIEVDARVQWGLAGIIKYREGDKARSRMFNNLQEAVDIVSAILPRRTAQPVAVG